MGAIRDDGDVRATDKAVIGDSINVVVNVRRLKLI